jgi:hypothetical protein
LLVLLLISQVLFVGDGQDLVVGIDDEHREQLCGFRRARVTTDRMMGAWRFVPALAGAVDALGSVVHLRLDGARDDVGIDEGRLGMRVRARGAPRSIIDDQGDQ